MKYFILLFILLISCDDSLNNKINHVIDVVTPSNIFLFKNIGISTRGLYKDSVDYQIVAYTYFQKENKSLILPPTDKMQWIEDTNRNFKNDIIKFGKINNIKEEEALSFYISYFDKISSLFKATKAIEVYNNPNLGDFTLFRIDESTDLIYLNDSMSITSEYWKDFFKCNKPFIKEWYIKKSK